MKKFAGISLLIGLLFLTGCQKITTTETATTGDIQELSWDSQELSGNIEQLSGIEETKISINSFEDCLNAGFPIMESYPRQCNDGTTTYTEILPEKSNTTGETIEENKEISEETGTNLSILQQKLRAMIERRNQQQNTTGTTVSPTNSWTVSSQPAITSSSSNTEVTEEDIENLENIIEEILKK